MTASPSAQTPAALLLRNWGCHVVAAASAAQAIERLQGHLRQPNVLLVDYRLQPQSQPHQTGAAAIHALRAALGADIPAVLVSGENATTLARCFSVLLGEGAEQTHKGVLRDNQLFNERRATCEAERN